MVDLDTSDTNDSFISSLRWTGRKPLRILLNQIIPFTVDGMRLIVAYSPTENSLPEIWDENDDDCTKKILGKKNKYH
jgi:hypothetical protein